MTELEKLQLDADILIESLRSDARRYLRPLGLEIPVALIKPIEQINV